MNYTRDAALLVLAATFLSAAGNPPWRSKPVAQWDREDAKQVLTESPWAGRVRLQVIPDRSPGERRDSGDWDAGAGGGAGLEATGVLGREKMRQAIARAHDNPSPGMVDIRWESAMPVRTAEEKLGQKAATELESDWYAITVYDVPLPESQWGANKLKGLAWVRRANKKDFKPSRAEVIRNDDGTATVTYLFSRSEEITRGDRTVIFAAQFDRLFVSRYFYPRTMQIAGKMEL